MSGSSKATNSAAVAAPVDFRSVGLCVRHVGSGMDTPCVLKDLNLQIRRGEQIAVIGASGAGKSTLLAALAMAREPHEGRLEVFGAAPWSQTSGVRHRLRRRLFLAPQVPPLPPRQRVVDAVLAGRVPRWSFSKALRSLIHPRDAGVARAALARFSLEDKLFDRVDRLSGGERQRVALARLLVAEVDAFLVDEPLSALDPTLAAQSLAGLQRAAAERGATLVCSLHQVELAHAQFPRLVGLRDGSVMFDLPRERVDQAMLDALYANAASGTTTSRSADSATSGPETKDDDLPLHIADGSLL